MQIEVRKATKEDKQYGKTTKEFVLGCSTVSDMSRAELSTEDLVAFIKDLTDLVNNKRKKKAYLKTEEKF
jgi:hypothetical protein